jgi:hypothetical protein
MGRHDFEVDLQNMMGDVEESGGRLGKIVMNYLEYEQNASKALEQLKGEIAARKIHGG